MLEILTVKQVAALLQVNTNRIYTMIDEGLPTIAIGSHYRINKEDLEAWLKAEQKSDNEAAEARAKEAAETEPGEEVIEASDDRPIGEILKGK